jgi:hypothetical protein
MKLGKYKWQIIGVAVLLAGSAVVVTQFFLPTTSTEPANDVLPVVTSTSNSNSEIEPLFIGSFTDTPGHPGQGTVAVYQTETNQILRLTDFNSTAGPDLFVYLATDENATDFINLGLLKSTSGDQNYDVPAGTNIEDYPYVLVWCKRFGVLFMKATIAEQN